MLQTPDTSPRGRNRKTVEIARLQTDPKARLEYPPPPPPPPVPPSPSKHSVTTATPNKPGGFMTLGPKKRLQKALVKILPKNTITLVNFYLLLLF